MLAPIGCSLEDVAGVAGRVEAWRGRALEVAPLAGGITNRNFRRRRSTAPSGTSCASRASAPSCSASTGPVRREAAARAAVLGIGPPVLAEALPGVGTRGHRRSCRGEPPRPATLLASDASTR